MCLTLARAAPVAAVCWFFAATPATVDAQHADTVTDTLRLDLAAARRIGLASSPVLQAAQAGVASALGTRRQAGAYLFNPNVELKLSSLIDPGDLGKFEGILTQEFEWAGQWGLRKSAAEYGVAVAEGSANEVARRTVLAIDAAFFQAVVAAHRLEVRMLGLDLTDRFQEAVRIQAREGKASTLEVNIAQIEFGRARAAERGARSALRVALVELARTIGLPPDRPIVTVDAAPGGPDPRALDPDSLLVLALATRPDLRAIEAAMARAEANRRLVSREAIPNLRVAAVATRGAVGEEVLWGLRFGFLVPLWNANGGLSDQWRGEAERAQAQRDAIELAVRADITSALEVYRSAWDELEAFERDVRRPARANQQLLQTAYDAGRMDLPTVMLLRTQLLEAELGYWDAWLSERMALASLQAAVGEIEDGPTSGR